MDPRRARDPRFARSDPRLQRPQDQPGSGPAYTPLPQQQHQPQQQYQGYPPHGFSNGGPSYAPPPPQPQHAPQLQQQYSSSAISNAQLTQEAEDVGSIAPLASSSQTSLQSPSDAKGKQIYKAKPLFCVVCASNQVRDGVPSNPRTG